MQTRMDSACEPSGSQTDEIDKDEDHKGGHDEADPRGIGSRPDDETGCSEKNGQDLKRHGSSTLDERLGDRSPPNGRHPRRRAAPVSATSC